ncbi:MAG: M20/M25/M40 family metallo-hydrolase, partial [bacterium]|nr:M20/M25/M40 family metallo-hydrolase [bacterium]
MSDLNDLKTQLDTQNATFLNGLLEFLRFQSVSTNPDKKADTLVCADFVLNALKSIGLDNAQLVQTNGYPVVYADWLHNENAPTVLIYGHYDVQPEDPIELWSTPPFEPTIVNGKIIARGASDNKGMIWAHICAVDMLLKNTGTLPVNIKFMIEGEEEIGSPNLAPALAQNIDLFKADLCLVSDNPMYDANTPSITTSLRGLVYLQVNATGANTDLHSGQHGGSVPNPLNALCSIIAKLKDENNRVTIPGFYDDVEPISPIIKKNLETMHFDQNAYKSQLEIDALACESGFSPQECWWYRPTLDVNGIMGGYTGSGAKTVLPSKGMAKISMRLVSKQNPKTITKLAIDYIHSLCPPGIKLNISDEFGMCFPAETP